MNDEDKDVGSCLTSKSAVGRIRDVAAQESNRPAAAVFGPSMVLGRVVQSPEYGKGFVSNIDCDAIRVRFWKKGYITFRKPETDYPFQLLNEIRRVENEPPAANASTLEIRLKRQDTARRCPHGDNRCLCLKCAGLTEGEIEKWNRLRTTGKRVNPSDLGLHRYFPVKLSSSDRVLVSRSENTFPAKNISYWYHCSQCRDFTKSPSELEMCPHCSGALVSVGEPFQDTQFSSEIGNGAKGSSYADAKRIQQRPQSLAAARTRDVYADPNSRISQGGNGFLRIPPEAPRSSRAGAPEWFDQRENFLKTLKTIRRERAERILYGFYVEVKTDDQIAESEEWAKDSIKKERKQLLQQGDDFFRSQAVEHPP